MKFKTLSLAALALMGAIITACSSSDDTIADTPQPVITPQQPENTSKTVTLTTTVGLDDGSATTRALTIDYENKKAVKTFAVGETMAITYKNTSGETVRAVSAALKAEDITTTSNPETDKKTATFTFELTNPQSGEVGYVYPAAAATADFNNGQDGTLTTLQSTFDYSSGGGMMTVDGSTVTLPADVTLTNIMPILAINLKDASSGRSITSGLNQVVISLFFPATPDNKATYTVAPTSGTFGTDVIYVAVHEKLEANVEITAIDGNDEYTKTLTNKDYKAGNFYNIGWLMTHTPKTYNLSAATGNITLKDGDTATGELNGNYKVSIADGATVTLDGVTINGNGTLTSGDYAGITCLGNATIILKDGTTNTVKGFYNNYPGIQAGPEGTTLTIDGTGTLEASSNINWAGIGSSGIGANDGGSCGNITIQGSVTVTATGGDGSAGIGCGCNAQEYGQAVASTCGDITIQGSANVTATGGQAAAGIGTGKGFNGSIKSICGNITIQGSANVTATGGSGAVGIGSSWYSQCGTITITIAPTVSKVTATKGSDASNSIGAGYNSTCGTVTIGGTVYWDGSAYQNDGEPILTQNKFVYPIESLDVNGVIIKYSVGETWRQAITDHSTLNTGWSIDDEKVKYTSYGTLNKKVNGMIQYVEPDEEICPGTYTWVEVYH